MSAIMENQVKLNKERNRTHEAIQVIKHYIIVVSTIVFSVNIIYKLHPLASLIILWGIYMKYKNNSEEFVHRTAMEKKLDLLVLISLIMNIYINKSYPLYISYSLLTVLYKKFIDVDEYVFCNT